VSRAGARGGVFHQFLPKLSPGDATSTHVIEIRTVLQTAGFDSEIFVDEVDERVADLVHPYREYGTRAFPAAASDVVLYHLAIGNWVADFVNGQPGRLLVDYHNITPVEYFQGWNPEITHGLSWGRRQLGELAKRAELGLADSTFNAIEMRQHGFRDTAVVPILQDYASFRRVVDPDAAARLAALRDAEGGSDVLFVGRISPNKAQHDAVKAFSVYRRVYDPSARLHFIGGPTSDRYFDALREFTAALDLEDAVHFAGAVPEGVLAAHYQAADVFACCSEHEGFCVPLLEAMSNGLPVVTVGHAAIPETLGDGGILLPRFSSGAMAAALDLAVHDPDTRAALVAAGARRLAAFTLDAARDRLVEALAHVGIEVGVPAPAPEPEPAAV
jgi:glycosyltransferase involved in cell wall biosynthesis